MLLLLLVGGGGVIFFVLISLLDLIVFDVVDAIGGFVAVRIVGVDAVTWWLVMLLRLPLLFSPLLVAVSWYCSLSFLNILSLL